MSSPIGDEVGVVSPTDAATGPQRSGLRSVAGATLVGSFIEWYDFYLFGTASALVFGDLFFPSFSPVAGTLLSFATFATAWFTRPLGGLIFGHLGDRMGRKRILQLTLLTMGLATVAIGLLPTFQTIGVAAPILLVLTRILQGISAGGEWSGTATMATEHAPAHRRGFYGSFPQLGIPLALIAANGITLLSYSLPEDAVQSGAWRIPFLLSALIIPVGYLIRRQLLETPDFVEVQQEGRVSTSPLLHVLRHHWPQILVVLFVMGGINAFFFTFTTYSLSYATGEKIGFTQQVALIAVIAAAAVHVVGTLVFGWLSDRWDRRRAYIVGMLLLAVSPFPLFALIDTGSVFAFVAGLAVCFGVFHSLVWSMAAVFFTELFPPDVRYSGSAIGYQFSGALFGGPIPIVAGALVAAASGAPWLAAGFVALVALAGAIALLLTPRHTTAPPAGTAGGSAVIHASTRGDDQQ